MGRDRDVIAAAAVAGRWDESAAHGVSLSM